MRTQIAVDQAIARRELDNSWLASAGQQNNLDPGIASMIQKLMAGRTLGYRYAVVTGILGKLVNPHVHPRAFQAHSKLQGAYDARSLCHRVVVIFEHEKGDLWGLSNEPFLIKALRHPEHDKANPQLRDKAGAILAHDILEWARSANSRELRDALSYMMILGRKRTAAVPKAVRATGSNLAKLGAFLEDFLRENTGGAGLVAVVATFVQMFNPQSDARVKAYPPNVSDQFGKTAGDIELRLSGRLVSAYECKDRDLNAGDISHGVRKGNAHSVRDYVFVTGPGFKTSVTDIERESKSVGFDVSWVSSEEIIQSWTRALDSERRATFGKTVIDFLLAMPKKEVAEGAERAWNRHLNVE